MLMSGCRIEFGEYVISGRVTSSNPAEVIEGVKIKYERNYDKEKPVYPYSDGRWTLWVNEGDHLRIWAEKDKNYIFEPAFYEFTVKGDRRNTDFRVIGWMDDFSNINSGWVRDFEKDYVPAAEYEVRVSYPYSIRVTAPLSVQKSYTVEATMYTQAGSGMYGLIFNAGNLGVGEFYYIFRVHPYEGYAEFLKAVKTPEETQTTTVGSKTNREIDPDNTTISSIIPNRLEVVQNAYFVKLFVNGVEVFYDYVDLQPGNHVKVGLYACPDDDSSHTVRFDDFRLTAMGFNPSPISNAPGFEKSIEISK